MITNVVKKCLVFGFLLTLIFNSFGFSAEAQGNTNEESPCVADFSSFDKQESKIIESNSGNTVYEIKDLEQAASELNIPTETDDGTLVSLAYSYTPQEVEPPIIMPFSLYIKVTDSGEACGTEVIRSSYYPGPSKPTMTISEKVSATFSSDVSVSASVITAGVGFSVTKEFAVSDSYSISVPAGENYNIKARPIYLIKNFEVWNDPTIGWDTKKGSGYAKKPIGVCFAVYK